MRPFLVRQMIEDILTLCWSIKEVNRNLSDRKATSDFSINYLKKACIELAMEMREQGKSRPNETLEVIDKKGHKEKIVLTKVSEMLHDARLIMEFNLIDNISRWAREQQVEFK